MALALIHLITPALFFLYQTYHFHCKCLNTLSSLFVVFFWPCRSQLFLSDVQGSEISMHWLGSCYTKMIEEVSHQDIFVVIVLQLFVSKKCLLLLLIPDFRHLYVHTTSTLSSNPLPSLGINMSLLLWSMCLGSTGQMGEVQRTDVEQGVRKRQETQRTRRNGYGGKAKEVTGSSEGPIAGNSIFSIFLLVARVKKPWLLFEAD